MPKKTIELLDNLQRLGFDNDAFKVIHHMDRSTINGHRSYCKKLSAFRAGDTNEKVRDRLEFVLKSFTAGNSRNPRVFVDLAKAAVVKIPKANS